MRAPGAIAPLAVAMALAPLVPLVACRDAGPDGGAAEAAAPVVVELRGGGTLRMPPDAVPADHEVGPVRKADVEQRIFRLGALSLVLIQFSDGRPCPEWLADRKKRIETNADGLGRARVLEEVTVGGRPALWVELEPRELPVGDGGKFVSAMSRIGTCAGGDKLEAVIADNQGKLPPDARKTLEALVATYAPPR